MREPILVTKPYLPARKTFDQYVDKIWNSHWLTNQGSLHEQFEREISTFLGGSEITLTTNGHLALEVAVKGLGLQGEVITTPFTFASSTHALVSNGIKPVFCDLNPSNLTINAEEIEKLITEKTTAIMPVHVYGHLCDTERIASIANKHHLKVIYDGAHAFGVKKDGRSIALCGDVTMFSFHATKIFHSIEGGALAYQNKDLKRMFNLLKNFGIENEETIDYVGGNAKMNEFQAAMGLSILPDLAQIIAERKSITLRYRENLSSIRGVHYFVPEENTSVEHNYAYMPVLIDADVYGMSRDALYDALKVEGIFARKYFYPLITDFGCYREAYKEVTLPIARKAASQVLCLPIYSGLSLGDVDVVCHAIQKLGNIGSIV